MAKDAGWHRRFDDPITVDGRPLRTLRDAADYVMKLPKAEQNRQHWQTAIRCLIGAAEGRDFLLHAQIGMLQAAQAAVSSGTTPEARQDGQDCTVTGDATEPAGRSAASVATGPHPRQCVGCT